MKLRRTNNEELVRALHTLCLPGDAWHEATAMWALWDGPTAIGFCTVHSLSNENGVFMARSGIFESARGHGLQVRMLRARERWAREAGREFAVTYTAYENHPSIVNLLRCGYQFYEPAEAWAGEVHYFYKSLSGHQ